MKKGFFLFSLLTISTIAGIALYSCKKKDKEKTNADYAGTWNVNETCTSTWSYQMTITTSGSNGVSITNFHKGTFSSGFTVTGTVADDRLTISSQNASSTSQGGPYNFSGSGTLSEDGKTLTISYTMKDMSGNALNCTATCTK